MASSFYMKDPTNAYLWGFPVRRLEAEIIPSASGQLNLGVFNIVSACVSEPY